MIRFLFHRNMVSRLVIHRIKVRHIGTVGAALAIILCAGMWGCGSGSNTVPLIDEPAKLLDQPSFVQDWIAPLNLASGESIKEVSLVADKVYVLTNDNIIFVMKRTSGEIIWQGPLGDPHDHAYGKPVIIKMGGTAEDEKAIFAIGHTLQVFNVHGRLEKTIDLTYNITTVPVAIQKLILVGLNEGAGRVDGVDLTPVYPHKPWSIYTNGSVDGSVGIGPQGSGIFIASEDGMVRACSVDRSPIWPLTDSRFDTGSKIFCGPAVDSFGVFVGNVDGSLFCLDRDNGQVKWRFYGRDAIFSKPFLTDDMVYQAVQGHGLAAVPKVEKITLGEGANQVTLDQTSIHQAKWWAPRADRVISTDDKNVYALSTTGTILALDKDSGQVAFESRTSGLKAVAANTEDSEIYCSTDGGLVFAVHPAPISGSYGRVVQNTAKPPKPVIVASASN